MWVANVLVPAMALNILGPRAVGGKQRFVSAERRTSSADCPSPSTVDS
jgi:hypothetical protein